MNLSSLFQQLPKLTIEERMFLRYFIDEMETCLHEATKYLKNNDEPVLDDEMEDWVFHRISYLFNEFEYKPRTKYFVKLKESINFNYKQSAKFWPRSYVGDHKHKFSEIPDPLLFIYSAMNFQNILEAIYGLHFGHFGGSRFIYESDYDKFIEEFQSKKITH